jgi:uncharacterized protein YecE (DUF72 family)
MVHVGCAGFPIPQTRYFRELGAVEIQETAQRVPGPGTVARWRREAPEGFVWTLLVGPGPLGGEAHEAASLSHLVRTLGVRAAVIAPAPTFAPTRANRSTVRAAIERLPRLGKAVWVLALPPEWPAAERRRIAGLGPVVVAADPTRESPAPGEIAYFRLPGPAGHRSRYEDPALARTAAAAADFSEVFAIFSNADMVADAKRLEALTSDG